MKTSPTRPPELLRRSDVEQMEDQLRPILNRLPRSWSEPPISGSPDYIARVAIATQCALSLADALHDLRYQCKPDPAPAPAAG